MPIPPAEALLLASPLILSCCMCVYVCVSVCVCVICFYVCVCIGVCVLDVALSTKHSTVTYSLQFDKL